MKILVISDLHIGDNSRADDFGKNDAKLMRWIKGKNPDKVYLNGDVWELWQFKSQAIRNAHFILWRYLHAKKFVHVRGNHDYQLMGPLTKTFKTKSGKRVLISHGFQNDPWMTNPFARLGIWALTWLERFIPNIDNENAYNKKRDKTRIEKKVNEYVIEMLKKYDMVICGHTHRQANTGSAGQKKYYNCGSCANGKLEGVLLDTDTDKIELVGQS